MWCKLSNESINDYLQLNSQLWSFGMRLKFESVWSSWSEVNKENWEILVVVLPKEAVPHGFSSLKLVVFLS